MAGCPADVRAVLATTISGIADTKRSTLDGDPDRAAEEITRWLNEMAGSPDESPGAAESLHVAREFPSACRYALVALINDHLDGVKTVRDAAWCWLFQAIDDDGYAEVGGPLATAVGEGEDRVRRAGAPLAAWAGAAPAADVSQVAADSDFAGSIRRWVDEEDDGIVGLLAEAVRSSPALRDSAMAGIGERPKRGHRRDVWDLIANAQ